MRTRQLFTRHIDVARRLFKHHIPKVGEIQDPVARAWNVAEWTFGIGLALWLVQAFWNHFSR